MNIAYIIPSLASKGPVLVVQELVAQMAENGHRCQVFYFDTKPNAVNFNCKVKQISPTEAINFSVFDIVHSHGMRPDKYIHKYREYSGHTKYVSTIHNYVLQDFSYEYNWLVAQIYGRLWMRALHKHDKIVALSQDAMQYYRRWFKPSELTYAYNTRNPNVNNPIEQNKIEELHNFKGCSTLIGVNCLLTKRKGVDLLINALVELSAYKLFIVGNGPELERLQKQARKIGVADRCFFAGYVIDAYRYLPYYDIYALPSRSEGFPLSLLEAAVYGKRCVVSDLPIIKECFAENDVAMFELGRAQTIVQAIERATNDSMMGDFLHNRYNNDYSPQKMYKRYIDIYNGKI